MGASSSFDTLPGTWLSGGISVLETEYIHVCTHGEVVARHFHHPCVVVFRGASNKNAKLGGVTVESDWNDRHHCCAYCDIATIVFGWISAVMCEDCRAGGETATPVSG